MDNLIEQIAYLRNTFYSLLVVIGQVIVGLITMINVIKHAKDSNLEKAGSAILQGIAFIILIGMVPNLLSSFK